MEIGSLKKGEMRAEFQTLKKLSEEKEEGKKTTQHKPVYYKTNTRSAAKMNATCRIMREVVLFISIFA